MFRLSRRRLFTFEALVSQGLFTSTHNTPVSREGVRAAAQQWTRLAPDAPLPLAVAAPLVVLDIRDGALEEAVATLVAHPDTRPLLQAVVTELSTAAPHVALPQLEQLLARLRASAVAGAAEVLAAMAQLVATPPGTAASEQAEGPTASSSTAPRARVRHALVRQIRFEPSSAARLLEPLCRVSLPVAHEVADVMDALRIATKGGGVVRPRDLAAVLALVADSGDVPHVASLWGWMQHTSVCWDAAAASAAMHALSSLGRLQDAVLCMQGIAEVGLDPTPQAQLALLQLLSRQRPPLPEYARQLVTHWYPQPSALWAADEAAVVQVGMALLQLLHACHDVDGLEAVLADADAALASQPPQRFFAAFLSDPVVTTLMGAYAAQPSSRAHDASDTEVPAVVAELFFHRPIADLASVCAAHEAPPVSVLAGLALLGPALGQHQAVLDAFAAMALDADAFGQISRAISEAPGPTPELKLRWLAALGAATAHKVPEEVRLWLELVQDTGRL